MNFPDISQYMQDIQNAFQETAYEMARPSILMRPLLNKVNNKWHCTYNNVVGIGETPADAMTSFDKEMTKYLQPHYYICKCGEEIEVEYKTFMEHYPCPKCKRRGQWIKQPF